MKYVLIGTGNISKIFIEAINNVEGSEIVACLSRSKKSPEAAPQLPSFASLQEIDLDFDAVIITTPNGLHHISVLEAALLKKHVLCEKPLDVSVLAMDKMIKACNEAGIKLGVCYQRRMSPDNLIIKSLLDKEALGRVLAVDLACKFWRDSDYYASGGYRGTYEIDGGGVFMQQACHNLDIYRWFFGMPTEIKSIMGTLYHSIEAEDHGVVLFRHTNMMIGTMVASTCTQPNMPARMEVHSDKGSFTTIDDKITQWQITGVPNPGLEIDQNHRKSSSFLPNYQRHEAIIRDFETAVKMEREPFIAGEDAKKTTELVLKIYEANVKTGVF